MEKLEIETTEDKLLDDLNMEKGLEIEEIRKMEIKLKKLKLPKKIKIKNRYYKKFQENICIIFQGKKYCDQQAFIFVNPKYINP